MAAWTLLAWDSETHRFAPGRMAPRVVCVQTLPVHLVTWGTTAEGHPTELAHTRVELWAERQRALLEAIKDPNTVHVGHNIAYDMAATAASADDPEDALRAVFRAYDDQRVICTQAQAQLLDIALGRLQGNHPGGTYSLEKQAQRNAGLELNKDPAVRQGYAQFDGVPVAQWPHAFWLYAALDAVATARVYVAQHHRAHGLGYLDPRGFGAVRGAALISRRSFALHLLSVHGIRVDPDAVDALEYRLHTRLEEQVKPLMDAGILTIRRGKVSMPTGRLRDMVTADFALQGRPPPRGEPTEKMREKDPDVEGNVLYDADTLATCISPALRMVADFSHTRKLITTYLPTIKIAARDGAPVAARWNALVGTGRTSCSGPNLQNLPQEPGVRQCYVPSPGCLFSSTDYSVEELRTLAQVCHSWGIPSALRQAFIKRQDPHLLLGARLAHVPVEELASWKKGTPEQQALFKRFRGRVAKAGNFGFAGMLGAAGFLEYARGYDVTDLDLAGAEMVRRQWAQQWPEMPIYFERIRRMANPLTERVTIQQLFSGRIRGGCYMPAAANSMFQGLTADGAGEALYYVQRAAWIERGSDLYGSRPVAFIHDEILAEHPEEWAAEAAAALRKIMVDVMQLWTPDVPQEAESALMECWDKAADPVFDETGRLIPWDAGLE